MIESEENLILLCFQIQETKRRYNTRSFLQRLKSFFIKYSWYTFGIFDLDANRPYYVLNQILKEKGEVAELQLTLISFSDIKKYNYKLLRVCLDNPVIEKVED